VEAAAIGVCREKETRCTVVNAVLGLYLHYLFKEIAAKFLVHCIAADIRSSLTVSKEAAGSECLRPIQPVDTRVE
jgi:hypothetical protein